MKVLPISSFLLLPLPTLEVKHPFDGCWLSTSRSSLYHMDAKPCTFSLCISTRLSAFPGNKNIFKAWAFEDVIHSWFFYSTGRDVGRFYSWVADTVNPVGSSNPVRRMVVYRVWGLSTLLDIWSWTALTACQDAFTAQDYPLRLLEAKNDEM